MIGAAAPGACARVAHASACRYPCGVLVPDDWELDHVCLTLTDPGKLVAKLRQGTPPPTRHHWRLHDTVGGDWVRLACIACRRADCLPRAA